MYCSFEPTQSVWVKVYGFIYFDLPLRHWNKVILVLNNSKICNFLHPLWLFLQLVFVTNLLLAAKFSRPHIFVHAIYWLAVIELYKLKLLPFIFEHRKLLDLCRKYSLFTVWIGILYLSKICYVQCIVMFFTELFKVYHTCFWDNEIILG